MNCFVRILLYLKYVFVFLGWVVVGLEVCSDGEGGMFRLEIGFFGIGGVGGGVFWIFDILEWCWLKFNLVRFEWMFLIVFVFWLWIDLERLIRLFVMFWIWICWEFCVCVFVNIFLYVWLLIMKLLNLNFSFDGVIVIEMRLLVNMFRWCVLLLKMEL